jgi:hypothetical protein
VIFPKKVDRVKLLLSRSDFYIRSRNDGVFLLAHGSYTLFWKSPQQAASLAEQLPAPNR